jgi:hypothetical protein
VLRTGKVEFSIPAASLDAALAALKAFEPGEFEEWYWKEAGFEDELKAVETVQDFLALLGWDCYANRAGDIYEVWFDPDSKDDDHFQREAQAAFERLAPYVAPNSFIEYRIIADDVADEVDYYRWFFDGERLHDQTGETSIVYK